MTDDCQKISNPLGIVIAYRTGGDTKGSHVIVIPRIICELKDIQKGDRFLVGLDDAGRIVYQRIETENERGRGLMDCSPSLSTPTPLSIPRNPQTRTQDE